MLIALTLLIAGAGIADRWLKLIALRGTVIDWPLGHFALVQNHALVFSWPAPNWVAIGMMCVVVAGLIWYLVSRWQHRSRWVRWAVLLLLLGAVSNLYDRVFYGYVIDWAYLGPWWPIFNLADVMIATGVVWWWLASRSLTKS